MTTDNDLSLYREGLSNTIDKIEEAMDKIKTQLEELRKNIGNETHTQLLAGELVGMARVIDSMADESPYLLTDHGIKSSIPKVWDVDDIAWIDDMEDD